MLPVMAVGVVLLSDGSISRAEERGQARDTVLASVPPARPLCLAGCPLGAPSGNRVISGDILIFSNNGATKFADWAAYIVAPRHFGPTRTRGWRADPRLPESETLEPEDYRGANRALGVDRGHMAPLASFAGAADWRSTNYLSNVTPQASALNRGPWARLEAAIRRLATSSGTQGVHVLTGPLFERPMPGLPNADEAHRIPSGYWKVVAITGTEGLEATAFVMDQTTPGSADYCALPYRITIADLERRSGLRLFPDLEPRFIPALTARSTELAHRLGCSN